jgi:MoaA/NifB/PqqE/SkfB family radical SAM enzyme
MPTFVLPLLDQLRDRAPQTLILTGGEPTLYPGFAKVVEGLAPWRGAVLLLTNGRPLGEEAIGAYFSGPGERRVIVSLHGTPEAHDRVTATPGSYRMAMAGFQRWRRLAESCGHPPPGINFVLSRMNLDQVPAILETAAGWGASQVRVDPVYQPRDPALDLVGLSDELLRRAEQWRELAAAIGIRLIDLSGLIESRPATCVIPQQTALIASNGSVYGCIPAKGGFRDETDGRLALGNLHAHSFQEIWQAPAYRRFRALAERRAFQFCNHCPPQHGIFNAAAGIQTGA